MIKLCLRLPPSETSPRFKALSAEALGVDENSIESIKITGRSLDARRGRPPLFLWNIEVSLTGVDEEEVARARGFELAPEKEAYAPPTTAFAKGKRPVVVGFGPAGMFAAYLLALSGASPLIIERGQDADRRLTDVKRFFAERELNPESNVQFGEGGAGTFSDGKLGTLVSDRESRIGFILRTFVRHGASPEIEYVNKPHVGTDVLVNVVKSLRQSIISLGGEFMFGTRLLSVTEKDGFVTGIKALANGSEITIDCDTVFLAIGHSARDTFMNLHSAGIAMEKKPFSMGVRIEHLQSDIDRAMYHAHAGTAGLPPADYKLSFHTRSGRAVYTFCMCPGGFVVPAASEEGGFVTNGMSYSNRGNVNANSALLVSMLPSDTSPGLFSGMELQKKLERKAFVAGGSCYKAPSQTLCDFLSHKKSTSFGRVTPSCLTGAVEADLNEILPPFMRESIAEALPEFGRKIRGFDDGESVLSGVESRSTCPLRILRDQTMQGSLRGLYPIGEGAGYAGGITSAAIDGMRAAEMYIRTR